MLFNCHFIVALCLMLWLKIAVRHETVIIKFQSFHFSLPRIFCFCQRHSVIGNVLLCIWFSWSLPYIFQFFPEHLPQMCSPISMPFFISYFLEMKKICIMVRDRSQSYLKILDFVSRHFFKKQLLHTCLKRFQF